MPACKHGAWDYCDQCLAEYATESRVRGNVRAEIDRLTRERDEARTEVARLRTEILRRYWWAESGAPCILCGYEGESYYQSGGPHECASLYAALEGRSE